MSNFRAFYAAYLLHQPRHVWRSSEGATTLTPKTLIIETLSIKILSLKTLSPKTFSIKTLSIRSLYVTPSIKALTIQKFSRTILSIKTFSIMTLSIKGLNGSLSITELLPACWVALCWVLRFICYFAESNNTEWHYGECHYVECLYAKCCCTHLNALLCLQLLLVEDFWINHWFFNKCAFQLLNKLSFD